MGYKNSIVHGALLIIASELMFATMGASIKAISTGLPEEMTVFLRNFFGLLIVTPMLLRSGTIQLKTSVFHLHMVRALIGLSAMYCFFFVLARIPLAEGVLLKMTAPIFIPLIAWLWLGERVPQLVLFAVPVGFAGVILVLKPGSDFSWLALVGLLGGLLAGVAKVTLRRLGRTEPTLRIVFYFALLATLVSAVPLTWGWQMPTVREWGLLLLMGAVGTAGQLLLTRGYAIAEPARIGPFTYFSVVFASAYGYLFWGELLDAWFLAGAVLIALAGVLAIRGKEAASLPAKMVVPENA